VLPESNILAIIGKKTSEIVWKVGPDYNASKALKKLGWIIGQHHVHMIPKASRGREYPDLRQWGWQGTVRPTPVLHGHQERAKGLLARAGIRPGHARNRLAAHPQGGRIPAPHGQQPLLQPFHQLAQRLPNGNTLITEGSGGRIFEVTAEHELVWEYISPIGVLMHMNMVYRLTVCPMSGCPSWNGPKQTPIKKIDVTTFRVPGAAPLGPRRVTAVEGVRPYQGDAALCVQVDVPR